MPLGVMQLLSVYGKNLSLTGAVFMTVTPWAYTTWQRRPNVMMHPQLKINDYYLTSPLVTLYWNSH